MSDRRSKPRDSKCPSVYEGLSPLAAQLLRQSGEAFHASQVRERDARRLARNVAAARRGLAQNASWSEAVLAAGAL